MSSQRVGGTIQVQANGQVFDAAGEFEVNMGRPKRETKSGQDGIHGFTEKHQPAYISGKVTDRRGFSLEALLAMNDVTVWLRTATDKIYVLRNAWYAGDGTLNTVEGDIEFRFEGKSCEEIA